MENAQYVFIDTKIHKLYPGITYARNLDKQFPQLCSAKPSSRFPVVFSALKTMLCVANTHEKFYPQMTHIGKCTPCRVLWERTFIDGWTSGPYSGFDFCDVFGESLKESPLTLENCLTSTSCGNPSENRKDDKYEYLGWTPEKRMIMDVNQTRVKFHEQTTAIIGVLRPGGNSLVTSTLQLAIEDGHIPWIQGLEEFLNFYNMTQHEAKTNKPGNWARYDNNQDEQLDNSSPIGPLVYLRYIMKETLEGMMAFFNETEPMVCWRSYQLVVRRCNIETGVMEYKLNKMYTDVYCFLGDMTAAQGILSFNNRPSSAQVSVS
jgi:hypothetical protein